MSHEAASNGRNLGIRPYLLDTVHESHSDTDMTALPVRQFTFPSGPVLPISSDPLIVTGLWSTDRTNTACTFQSRASMFRLLQHFARHIFSCQIFTMANLATNITFKYLKYPVRQGQDYYGPVVELVPLGDVYRAQGFLRFFLLARRCTSRRCPL